MLGKGLQETIIYRLTMILFLTLPFCLAAGCAKPPTEEVIKAEKAVEDARKKEADFYAQEQFLKAQESFDNARRLVSEKRYEEARGQAVKALKYAEQSMILIEPVRDKMKAEAELVFYKIQRDIDYLKSIIEKIEGQKNKKKPALKGFNSGKVKIDTEDIQALIEKWEAQLTDIKEKLKLMKIKEVNDELALLKKEVKAERKRAALYLKGKQN